MKTHTPGRKLGSKNKLSPEAREALFELLESDLKRIDKLILSGSYEERVIHLKHFAKLLTNRNDAIALETRELIFTGLKEHYEKLNTYFPHVRPENKSSELRQYLKLLDKDQIDKVFN